MLTIDGSRGEGGGQILRTALGLSLVTGQPFRMTAIRAGRGRPGLLRQHLTCVQAAAEVGQARVSGDAIGSSELTFSPTTLQGGERRFAVGTAGSTLLVWQAILPGLLRAPTPTTLRLEGGTHNPAAPTFEFIEHVFAPLLARLGASLTVHLDQPGFYPAGGGQLRMEIAPWRDATPLHLRERGEVRAVEAIALLAGGIPYAVAERELAAVSSALAWPADRCRPRMVRSSRGPGNVLLARIDSEHATELVSAVGERGKPAEAVAADVIEQVRAYLDHGAPVGEHLADQLMLPLALGAGGSFVAGPLSLHARTQVETMRLFLGDLVRVTEQGRQTLVEVEPAAR
ncbi:MAG: RNA 3'-terminal phosphate cyclase [Myxococcales bacterium]|nr:MAG: RNA 3'-terminal phosphate cyclase [Myxococcales bacterium]